MNWMVDVSTLPVYEIIQIGVSLLRKRQDDQMTINPGDVVQLKSGGPAMTVVYPSERNNGGKSDSSYCIWFLDGKVHGDTFNHACLAAVPTYPEVAIA